MNYLRHLSFFLSACLHPAAGLAVVGVVFGVSFGAAADGSKSIIPVETFAALPSFESGRLSPSGKKIAYFREDEGRRSVIVTDLEALTSIKVGPQENGGTYIDMRWANNTHLLITISFSGKRAGFRRQITQTRSLSLDVEKTKFVWLGRPKKSYGSTQRVSQLERVIDLLPSDPNHVLIQLDLDLNNNAEVYRVDVRNGRRTNAQRPHAGIQNWYTDHTSEVRLGFGYNGKRKVARFKTRDGDWKDLDELSWSNNYGIEGFTDNPSVVYASGYSDKGTEGLYRINIETGEKLATVFEDDTYDIQGAIEHPTTGKVAGVAYVDHYFRRYFFDKELQKIQANLDAALPDMVVTILDHAIEKDLYLILVKNAQVPGIYFIYDRPKKSLMKIAEARPEVNHNLMAQTKSATIEVRDGEKVNAYITIPPDVSGKPENLPTVILPHGGPTARDTAEWDYEAQFYANRGYLVVKPNFRGSSGYGIRYRLMGKKQWGGRMQDDVTDVTKFFIDNGYSDPERICIVGNSYGGYAALMGAILEPDMYRCAVSVNGVADLVRLKAGDRSNAIGGSTWIKNMGLEGVEDSEVSPHHRADDIKTPVLLIAAKDDARVPYGLSKALYKRLKKLGSDVEYLQLKEGTHHMITSESRLKSLKATEKFLRKHIGE